jgi:predicted nuclease of predicted toxin-antitoxin system
MRFLIDANLPRSIVTALQRFGHEVEFARDIGLGAARCDAADRCSAADL